MIHKCNKCNKEYEFNTLNFYKQGGRLRKVCKRCVDEQNRLTKKPKPRKELEYDNKLYIDMRLSIGISQFEAAKQMGITYQTLANIEQGKYKTAHITTLDKINEFYGIG